MNLFFVLLLAFSCFGKAGIIESNSFKSPNANHKMHDTIKKPTVFLEESLTKPMTLLVIRDTAATVADISQLFQKDYGELFTFINKNTLIPGKVMAFYHSYGPPFFVDVAVEVNRIPGLLTERIKAKYLAGGNAVIARYQGPYEQVEIAYTAITNWLKQQRKEAKDKPFEVYLNHPSEGTDPFALRTDVYQLIK